MHILFIVAYIPNLVRTRPYNLIRHLTARGHRVTVLTLWTTDRERAEARALEQHCHRVVALPQPRWRSLWNSLRALPTAQPLQAHYSWNPALARYLDAAIRNTPYDVIHVEHLRAARYGLSILHSPFSTPIIWDSVDCISYLFEQSASHGRGFFARVVTRLELPRTRRYEGRLVRQFDRVLVTSEIDKAALTQLANSQLPIRNSQFAIRNSQLAIHVLPNGVDLDYFTPTDEPREPATLVLSGKMSYHANVTAALHLLNDVMPYVWRERPDVQVWIVGKDPAREITHFQPPELAWGKKARIVVTGTVPDLRPYLQKATIAVVPLVYGAGTQFKVLEAAACQTPVVATSIAVGGLQAAKGRHFLVADGAEAFARAVLDLLADPMRQRELGQAGRRYVETHHDWDRIAARLEQIYEKSRSA